ncbi:MAG: C25 family cysteine peptidase [Planctomycetota bacterium]
MTSLAKPAGIRSVLVAMGLTAALVPVAATSAAVGVEVLADNGQRTVIRYEIGGFQQQPVAIDGAAFTELVLQGEGVTKEVGAPEVPIVCRSIIIPDDAAMQVNVLDSAFREIHDIDVVPSKGFISRAVNPADVPWKFGDAYENDAFSPGPLVKLSEPYIMRDHRGIVVRVYPFQYNPVQRVLRVYTDITLEVVTAGQGQVNVLNRPNHDRALSRAFHGVYGAHFINYASTVLYDPLDEVGEMLIICHDPWIPHMEPFAGHKNSIGIGTTIVGVSSIGNNETAIKAHIQQVYDTSDLAFVLLVGDGQHVEPAQSSGAAADPVYSLLAGSDSYPDIMVGRFSAESVQDVQTQVDRTIAYEMMPATLQDWFWKGTGVASNQGPGDDGEYDNVHVGNIRTLLLANGYTEMDEIYDPSGTAAMVSAALNEGRGIVVYTGHGSTTSWGSTGFSNTHVNALTNDNMLPFITSVACVNGNFDGPLCFGEAWLRATNGGAPTGSIGFYGSSINQSWDPPMEAQDELAEIYCQGAYFCYGTLCYAGSCSMMDVYGGGGVSMFNTWHLFGDPSVCVVGTAEPPSGLGVAPFTSLVSEGPNGGPFTPASIEYTLTNYEADPIEYEVTTGASWVVIGETGGALPPGGDAVVTVSIGPGADSMANGHYVAAVSFTNTSGSGGDTERNVILDVGVPEPIHVYDLDTQPGSFMTGEWGFGVPLGQGGAAYGGPDPTSGFTGINVFGVNLAGDYSTTPGGPWFATLRAIDCSDLYQTQLRYMRWLNSDYQPYAYATVEVSNDGVNWVGLWDNGSDTMSDSSWTEQVFDISEVADGQQYVYVRWGYEIGSGAWAYSGWNLDDIEIWGVPPSGPDCPADLNGDDVVDVSDFLQLLGVWGQSGVPEDINGDGTVDVLDFLELIGSWGPC